MSIYRKGGKAQLEQLRRAVDLWSSRAFEDGVAPFVRIRVKPFDETNKRAVFLPARIIDVALPYHDVANPTPILVFQRPGTVQPVFLPATEIFSIIGPENDARVIQ